jgi:Notch-like protein
MKNNHAMMLLTLVLAFGLAMSGCHADSECVGNCPSDDTQEEGDGPDQVDQETDGDGPDVPDGVDGEGVDTGDVIDDEAADGPDGCSPCEYLFPNCVEDHTCCADPYGTETCNGLDDDCDGEVDEDINFDEDPRNCGECGNDCRLPHAEVRCQEGDCVFIRCLTYYQDCVEDDPLDPDTLGCEYYCVTSADDDAVCDELDNDCDCRVDEDIDLTTDIDHCGNCSTRCRFPHADAECYSPDGTPENAVCRIAACHDGYWNDDGILTNGCEYECTPCEYLEGACVLGHTCCTMDGAETCNSLDDDCDGDTDDGNPGGGASCGTDEGECVSGIPTCTDGTLVCGGDTGPAMETCDGLDNDCDGTPDEPDDGEIFLPDENVPCGETRGDCEPGLTVCVGGSLDCQGGVGPASETCDGHDNDCDGSVDELPLPGVGLGCGTDTGECVAGTTACQAGGIVCSGETGPVPEVCDGLDND